MCCYYCIALITHPRAQTFLTDFSKDGMNVLYTLANQQVNCTHGTTWIAFLNERTT